MQGLATLDDFFRHPLVLVLATALVSAYLLPRLSKRWQDHQKSIEFRNRFASEATEAVVRFLLAVQFAERHAIEKDAYDTAYQQWEVRRATLASEFRGHFEDAGIATDWTSLSEAVTALYRLSGTYSEPFRSRVLGELEAYFAGDAADWEVLRDPQAARASDERFQAYFAAWWKLREAALLRTGDLSRRILGARTTAFG